MSWDLPDRAMKRSFYAVAALFLFALYVYFLGTPQVASLTGVSLRAVSLTAGFAIAILGFALMALGKLAVKNDTDRP